MADQTCFPHHYVPGSDEYLQGSAYYRSLYCTLCGETKTIVTRVVKWDPPTSDKTTAGGKP